MKRILALAVFLLLDGASTSALADLIPDEPDPVPSGPRDEPVPHGSYDPWNPPQPNSCAANYEDDAILGLAALALLISSVALRRRRVAALDHHNPMPSR
jgi:hypothetical protein